MGRIEIIGLGPGSPRHLTVAARRLLFRGQPLFLRTARHPVAGWLRERGVPFRSFDGLYHRAHDFETVYRTIVRQLAGLARRLDVVYFAVPGHPLAGEAVVRRLLRIAPGHGLKIKLISGISFLEPVLSALELDLLDGVAVIDALAHGHFRETRHRHLVLAQVHSRAVAFRVKLKLLDRYPPEHPVTIIRNAGMPGQQLYKAPLYILDRHSFNHHTCIYLPPAGGYSLEDMSAIMARLRSRKGCPWDRKQTHHSLREYLIEEAYEVVAAIEHEDDTLLQEELGDLLLQVVFHSCIAREESRFDLDAVINAITAKLVRRHPHVFGTRGAANISQAITRWEEVKSREKGQQTVQEGLPALLGAHKLQVRAAAVGFDWPRIDGAIEKLKEEVDELKDAYTEGISGKIEEEFGDFLFAAVNVARFLDVNPEMALGKALRKFATRFDHVLSRAAKEGKPVDGYTLEQLDRWWEEAKLKGKNS